MAPDLFRLLCITLPKCPPCIHISRNYSHTQFFTPLWILFIALWVWYARIRILVPDKIILQQESYCILSCHCLWREKYAGFKCSRNMPLRCEADGLKCLQHLNEWKSTTELKILQNLKMSVISHFHLGCS